ncbi:hypothetical protein [Paraburkholderia sp. HP33-1]|uniref:hypothetical protein n=1 Tax=Paraburkholderia sp. HP33-1 TaxID=2883243 RepID=UPI001F2BD285|nr:hypothetical protein [Paraburkholderia sp. HP33-1]
MEEKGTGQRIAVLQRRCCVGRAKAGCRRARRDSQSTVWMTGLASGGEVTDSAVPASDAGVAGVWTVSVGGAESAGGVAIDGSPGLAAECSVELIVFVLAGGSSLLHAPVSAHSAMTATTPVNRLRRGAWIGLDTKGMALSPGGEGMPRHRCAEVSDAAA